MQAGSESMGVGVPSCEATLRSAWGRGLLSPGWAVVASSGDRLSEQARDVHLRDAEPPADLGLGEVVQVVKAHNEVDCGCLSVASSESNKTRSMASGISESAAPSVSMRVVAVVFLTARAWLVERGGVQRVVCHAGFEDVLNSDTSLVRDLGRGGG